MSGLRKFALEQPVIFWSFVIGGVGPALVYGVPKVRREFFGYKGVPGLPLTYPSKLNSGKCYDFTHSSLLFLRFQCPTDPATLPPATRTTRPTRPPVT
ncbi:hypothetical protein BC940DRAFT_296964 [Gongronella butleri]|nr:hypothetical protein BC940DRAFT_296964 [Gongronella butleri]